MYNENIKQLKKENFENFKIDRCLFLNKLVI